MNDSLRHVTWRASLAETRCETQAVLAATDAVSPTRDVIMHAIMDATDDATWAFINEN